MLDSGQLHPPSSAGNPFGKGPFSRYGKGPMEALFTGPFVGKGPKRNYGALFEAQLDVQQPYGKGSQQTATNQTKYQR